MNTLRAAEEHLHTKDTREVTVGVSQGVCVCVILPATWTKTQKFVEKGISYWNVCEAPRLSPDSTKFQNWGYIRYVFKGLQRIYDWYGRGRCVWVVWQRGGGCYKHVNARSECERESDGRSWWSVTLCHRPGTQLGLPYYHDNYGCTPVENVGSYNGDEFWSEWALHLSLACLPYKRSVLTG